MASTYSKAIKQIQLEHDLEIVDPDLPGADADPELYALYRDAKSLWQEDQRKWEQVVRKFNCYASELRSNGVHEPKGNPTILTHNDSVGRSPFMQLFQRLIDNEKATFVPHDPQSTIPCTSSHQEGRIQIAYDGDLQDLPNPYAQSRGTKQHYPSSGSEIYAPSSSLQRFFHDLDPDDFGQQGSETPNFHVPEACVEEEDVDNGMVIDQQHLILTDPLIVLEQPQEGIWNNHRSPHLEATSRKRHASTSLSAEGGICQDKLDNGYPPRRKGFKENGPNFSFSNARESFPAREISGSTYDSDSDTLSFKSMGTEVNESFATHITMPSFASNKSTNLSDIRGREKLSVPGSSGKFTQFLLQNSPFTAPPEIFTSRVSYPVHYETCRVALHNGYDLTDILGYIQTQPCLWDNDRNITDLDTVWRLLKEYMPKNRGCLPSKTPAKVWSMLQLPRTEFSHSKLSFTGKLSFGETDKDPLLNFKLDPITLDESNRLKRRYGSDRFFLLEIPSLEPADLPSYLQNNATEFRYAFIDWLTATEHNIVGRNWRAFYVKNKSKSKGPDKKSGTWRVYLFATDGPGFVKYYGGPNGPHQAMPLHQILESFFSFKQNLEEPMLKLFSRLQLAVSPTKPTLTFQKGGKIPKGTGRLFQVRDINCNGKVMTDGCGRISLKAAEEVSKKLGLLPPFPCAFQGRIAGAKGMWIVEPDPNVHKGCDLWIEIRNSQVKFDCLPKDGEEQLVDEFRTTFEVRNYSRPLRPAPLNFQLLAILIDRGVKPSVFSDILKADLETKVADIGSAVSQAQSLRAWNQENFAVSESRVLSDGILWEGGMPQSDAEQINALTEVGFTPKTCSYLQELCRGSVSSYCKRVEDQIKIYPGKTTFAYMVPDPYSVLEENDIHIGFSSAFTDKRSNWSNTMLHGMDVLVARLPAALPSDIHKVRAVFKPELAHLKDVVVFPTQGDVCLADKLSGGDYDGDLAWICWNEAIVKDFKNCPIPFQKGFWDYGITKIDAPIKDILDLEETVRATTFIKAGFEFNMRKSQLGRVTNYHEAYCYKLVQDADRNGWNKGEYFSPMSDKIAIDLAYLRGYLVDTAKNGYIFTEEDCEAYLESVGGKYLPNPAYKKINGETPTNHAIDQLVFETATTFRQDALKKLDCVIGKSFESRDMDLVKVFLNERQTAEDDQVILFVLEKLMEDIKNAKDKWNKLTRQQSKEQLTWPDVHNLIRQQFLGILPAETQDTVNHPLVKRWRQSLTDGSLLLSNLHSWTLLKASALYSQYSSRSFPWRSCGKELLAIKILVNQNGVSIAESMHRYFKFNRKMWEAAKSRQSERGEFGEVDEISPFDEDQFLSQTSEDAYESLVDAE